MISFSNVARAEIEVVSFSVVRLLDGYRLQIGLRFDWSDVRGRGRYSVHAVKWDMFAGEQQSPSAFIATARMTGGYGGISGGRSNISLDADVPVSTILRLDEFRPGDGSLLLCGVANVTLFDTGRVQNGNAPGQGLQVEEPGFTSSGDNLKWRVSKSDWIDLLAKIGVRDRILFDIEMPPLHAPPGRFGDALNHLREAHTQFLLGHYDEAGGLCRDAYEVLNTVLADAKPTGDSKLFSFSDRVKVLRESARALTHLGKHKSDPQSERWSRTDAQAILAITASLIAVCSQPPR